MQLAGAVFLPSGSSTMPAAGFDARSLKLLGNEEAMMPSFDRHCNCRRQASAGTASLS